MWVLMSPLICYAEIASDNAFEGVSWEMVREEPIVSQGTGVVQSICCTQDYIVCIENTSDFTTDPDTISIFYKNDVDADGNPVEQYSLFKQITDKNYEHANGMAYNPNTNEILVSLYTNNEGDDNIGSIYIMDASTFEYKTKVQISTDYNILGIDYDESNDRYVIQTDVDGNYSFKILDSNYQIIEDLGEYADTAEGDNFQDLCVVGDYIINFPLTLNLGIGDLVHMYSISRKTMVSSSQLDFKFEGVTSDEPESLCEIDPGVFLAAVNVTLTDGSKKMRLYRTTVPYNFTVTTSAENGTISDGSKTALSGESYKVTFSPDEKYKLSALTIDGSDVDITKYPDSYTFENVSSDHTVKATFEEMTFGEKVSSFFSSGKDKKTAEVASADQENKSDNNASKKDDSTKNTKTAKSTDNTKKSYTGLIIALVILVILGGLALYLRIIYVRRMRIIKRRRANRERRRIIHEYQEHELDELEDIEMREYIEIK